MEKLENFLNNLKQVDLFAINFRLLADWSYLTDTQPSKYFVYEQWIYVIVLFNIIFAASVFKFAAKLFINSLPKYYLVKRIAFAWIVNSIFLLLYNLFRSQGVSFLSMRLFLVLVCLGYPIIIGYALWYWVVRLPRRMKKFHEAKLRSKYEKRKK
jgi:hypothetical protein